MPTLAEALAAFALRSYAAGLPDAIFRQGRRAFVNWIGCAYGGCDDPAMLLALQALAPFGGAPEAVVVGRPERTDILLATLLNAVSVSAHAFDDTHFATVAHPTAPVGAALLALAQRVPITGSDMLRALVLGVEVQCRVGNMLCTPPAACPVGLSMAGLVGGIGAAVAAGLMLGLDAPKLTAAIGVAANQSAGLREAHATMASHYTPGHAARCGLQSALLAGVGYSCTPAMLEGPKGFAVCFASQPQPEATLADLGEAWEIADLAFKPYPTGFVVHPVIDACLEIAGTPGFDAAAVGSIDLAVNPLVVALTDRPSPTDRLQAIVSTQHWAAAVLLHGAAGLAQGTDAMVHHPAVAALRRCVRLAPADAIALPEVRATVTLRDGRRIEAHVRDCRGSAGRPMTDPEIGRKFLDQVCLRMPKARAEALLEETWRVHEAADAGSFARSLSTV